MKIANKQNIKTLEVDEIRKCSVCEDYMLSGYLDEEMAKYYCTETCLDNDLSKSEKEQGIEDGTLFLTEWTDSEVYSIYDNQYATFEDALYIQNYHGNLNEPIQVKIINLDKPVYKIVDGQQLIISELELEREISRF